MNCITLTDNSTGTEHITETVSDKCLKNLKILEHIGEFKRFDIDIHSLDAPRKYTDYNIISEWLHKNAFPTIPITGIKTLLKTK